MDILYLLIPISIIFVVIIAGVFIWSVKSGQYEDMEGPAHRILMDNDGIQSNQDHAEQDPDERGPDKQGPDQSDKPEEEQNN